MNSRIKGTLAVGLIAAGLALAFSWAGGIFGRETLNAPDFVNLQQGTKPHAGFRRAHAKGLCISGEFVSNGNLATYSVAQLFEQGSTPFTGRYSIGGGNPTAPDLASPVRSLALSLAQANGEQWRTAMNTPPVLAVGNPVDFFEQLQSLQPDPATGKPDRSKIMAFFQAHPESAAFLAWQKTYSPTASFASEQFHGINAFYLVDRNGNQHAVRWAAVPRSTSLEATLDRDNPNALQEELIQRLQNGPVQYDLVFTFANDSDVIDNGAIPWAGERKQITAGTISITRAEDQSTGNCNAINFDPLVLPRGIAPSGDPILRARSAAYAESYRRRARETLLESN